MNVERWLLRFFARQNKPVRRHKDRTYPRYWRTWGKH